MPSEVRNVTLCHQEDLSTPLHFAASQGNLHMIEKMLEFQAENFLSALNTRDAMQMVPLHRAAIFNHSSVVTFFLKQVKITNAIFNDYCFKIN